MGILTMCGLAQLTDGIQQLSVGFLLHHLGKLFGLTNHGKAMIGTGTVTVVTDVSPDFV